MAYEIFNIELPKPKKTKYKKRAMNEARANAIKNNERYYQGNPCKRGHNGKRLTKDGQCVECRSILRKNSYPQYRARGRKYELKTQFGITVEKYNEMFKLQNGVCAICKQPETVKSSKGRLKQLAVDHCHDTIKVRGLLCYTCNVGIGFLKHNPNILRIAALYCEDI